MFKVSTLHIKSRGNRARHDKQTNLNNIKRENNKFQIFLFFGGQPGNWDERTGSADLSKVVWIFCLLVKNCLLDKWGNRTTTMWNLDERWQDKEIYFSYIWQAYNQKDISRHFRRSSTRVRTVSQTPCNIVRRMRRVSEVVSQRCQVNSWKSLVADDD